MQSKTWIPRSEHIGSNLSLDGSKDDMNHLLFPCFTQHPVVSSTWWFHVPASHYHRWNKNNIKLTRSESTNKFINHLQRNNGSKAAGWHQPWIETVKVSKTKVFHVEKGQVDGGGADLFHPQNHRKFQLLDFLEFENQGRFFFSGRKQPNPPPLSKQKVGETWDGSQYDSKIWSNFQCQMSSHQIAQLLGLHWDYIGITVYKDIVRY